MIHSSRRDRKTKAIAEALAMIPNVHPELVPHRPRPVRETDECGRAPPNFAPPWTAMQSAIWKLRECDHDSKPNDESVDHDASRAPRPHFCGCAVLPWLRIGHDHCLLGCFSISAHPRRMKRWCEAGATRRRERQGGARQTILRHIPRRLTDEESLGELNCSPPLCSSGSTFILHELVAASGRGPRREGALRKGNNLI
jgi:hypothetical protein